MSSFGANMAFWDGLGITRPMLNVETLRLKTALNERNSDQTLLTKDEGNIIVKRFNAYIRNKLKKGWKKSDAMSELFPDDDEVRRILDEEKIGSSVGEERTIEIDMSAINPIFGVEGGERRKRKRRRTKKRRKRRRTKKKRRRTKKKRRRTKKRRRN